MIIDGKKIAEGIINNLKAEKTCLPAGRFLAAIIIGQDPASLSFLKIKEKTAKELNIDFRLYQIPETIKKTLPAGRQETGNDYLRKEILRLSKPKNCGGVIVQLPLPQQFNQAYVLNAIPPEKDVDVLSERSLGSFYNNRFPILPPAVGAVREIIENCKLKIENYRVAVIGLGFLIGKPIATWLMNQKTGNICLIEKNGDLTKINQADIVISGVGSPGLIQPEMLKENALMIDFGYGVKNGKISGDFDASEIENGKLKIENLRYTPTPGGTGPILVAKLFENFYKLNQILIK